MTVEVSVPVSDRGRANSSGPTEEGQNMRHSLLTQSLSIHLPEDQRLQGPFSTFQEHYSVLLLLERSRAVTALIFRKERTNSCVWRNSSYDMIVWFHMVLRSSNLPKGAQLVRGIRGTPNYWFQIQSCIPSKGDRRNRATRGWWRKILSESSVTAYHI